MGNDPENASREVGYTHPTERRFILLVLGITLVLQFIFVSITFPLPELLSNKPLFHIDAAWHWYHIKVAQDLFETGKIVGYDPTFNAGYPGGVTYNWSAKLPAALATLLKSHFNEIIAYKLYAFMAAVIAPACLPLALFVLRLRREEILIGSLFGLILWWTSMFRWYHTAGMVSFVAGSFVSLAYLAKVLQCLTAKKAISSLIAMGAVGALATFWHPLFPVPVAIGVLVYLVWSGRVFDRTNTARVMTIVPLIALLGNLFWLYPMHHYQRVFAAGVADISPYGKVVSFSNLWIELAGIWRGDAHGSKIYAPIALAAIWGWFAGASSRRPTARIFALLAIILIVVAHLGGAVPLLRFLQPNRFAPVGYLFACVSAGIGIFTMLRAARSPDHVWMRRMARASLALVALIAAYSVNEVRREMSWTPVGHYGAVPPEVREVGDLSRWVVNWLDKETTPDGRILFETSKARFHDGAHMAGYYAYTSGRKFIGGPYPFANFAGFWDGFAFGKSLARMPQQTFTEYLDAYNIGWILVHSRESQTYLDQMPGVGPVAAYKGLKAYRCERTLSYFLRGNGRVAEQAINRIVLSDLDGTEILIKFHYVPGLKSDPPATMVPVHVMGDPNPFVKILNPPKRIRLFM